MMMTKVLETTFANEEQLECKNKEYKMTWQMYIFVSFRYTGDEDAEKKQTNFIVCYLLSTLVESNNKCIRYDWLKWVLFSFRLFQGS